MYLLSTSDLVLAPGPAVRAGGGAAGVAGARLALVTNTRHREPHLVLYETKEENAIDAMKLRDLGQCPGVVIPAVPCDWVCWRVLRKVVSRMWIYPIPLSPHLMVPDPRPRVVVDPALAAAAVGHDGAVLAGGEHRAVRVRGAAAARHPPVVRQPEPVPDLLSSIRTVNEGSRRFHSC